MKPKTFAIIAIIFSILFSVSISAQETEVNDSLIGILSVSKDAGGNITGASLEAETYDENDNVVTVSYRIEMDETGKQLAQQHDGAEVNVTGTIKEAKEGSNDRSMTVVSFEATSDEVPMEPAYDEPIIESDVPDIDETYEEVTEEVE
ncbi:MAG: hypothetical protein PWR01_4178 [Clostridiales bacterium]|jgi:hypothetical protein|nr:hypothetical protein [Clostridiales bacterium]MDN5283105.1 hypothetical protein [Candidatus Ozemobacter sp.]